jgi:hypothetical protein
MHAVVRAYSGKGARELSDVLEKRKAEVETIMRSVKGFASDTLFRSADGCVSVTVCADKAGADESRAKARDWVAKNAAGTGVGAPTVFEGPVTLHLK